MNKYTSFFLVFFVIIVSFITFYACSIKAPIIESKLVNEPVFKSKYIIDARVYKIAGNRKIELHIFYPDKYDVHRKKAYAVGVCFGGGAWVEGNIEYSYNAIDIASSGMVGIAVDYRRADYKKVSVLDAMKDASSSIRWVRTYAKELNIDPSKVMAFGISSGGHLAISTAMFPQFIGSGEDPHISSIPNIVVTVCPAVAVNIDPYFQRLLLNQEKAINCSPLDQVHSGVVPIYIIQGTADEVLPYHYTEEFAKKMNEAGNKIYLYPFLNGKHDFYYLNPDGEKFWKTTFHDIVKKLGWSK